MKLIVTSLIALTVAAPAIAQSAPAGDSFTGFRLEAHAGYDRVGTGGLVGHPDGITYGLGAGYDMAIGSNLIAGVEVNGDFSNTDADYFGYTLKAKRDLDASVRIGTKVGTRALLYLKVGYANARFTAAGFGSNNDGVRGAVGAEYAFSNRVYVKGEYRYTNYEAGLSRNQVLAGVGMRF